MALTWLGHSTVVVGPDGARHAGEAKSMCDVHGGPADRGS